MKVYYSPRKVLVWLLIIFLVLLLFDIIGILIKYNYDNSRLVQHIYSASSFNSEVSLSTLHSSVLLLIASGLLFIIHSCLKIKKNKSWLLLSIIFLYMSIDESISIHEKFITIFRDKFNLSGLLYYSWVIPYAILMIILLITLIPFLIKLEKSTRNLFIISGGIFVLGAMGIEIFEGRHAELYGHDIGFEIFHTIEESFEMIGVSIFIYALLRYISMINSSIQVTSN